MCWITNGKDLQGSTFHFLRWPSNIFTLCYSCYKTKEEGTYSQHCSQQWIKWRTQSCLYAANHIIIKIQPSHYHHWIMGQWQEHQNINKEKRTVHFRIKIRTISKKGINCVWCWQWHWTYASLTLSLKGAHVKSFLLPFLARRRHKCE